MIRNHTAHNASLLEATLESTADGILVADLAGKIIRFNRKFVDLWGLSKEILDAREDKRAIQSVLDQLKDPETFTQRIKQLNTTPEVESYDVLEFNDGRIVERYSQPQKLGAKIIGRVWSFRDVTAKREAEKALKQAHEELKNIMNSISNSLWSAVLDKDGELTYRYCSPIIEKITGKPPTFYMEGQERWLSTVHPDDVGRLVQAISRIKHRQSSHEETEYRIFHTDGSVRWVRDSVSVLLLPNQDGIRLDGVISDITEQKNIELQRERLLEQENKLRLEAQKALHARTLFISIASHELKTPLTSLKMQLDFLSKVSEQPQNAIIAPAQLIEGCKKEADRFASLVDVLLDISRISTSHFSLNAQPMSLSGVLKEMLQRHHSELELAKCSLLMNIDDNVTGVWDRIRVEQVVTNLLSNAIKFGKTKPIEISLRSNEKAALLSVKDQGIGISKEKQIKIFEPFERAVLEKSFSGMGLGLYITNQIVQAHSGTITLESEPQKGSTFTVTLPKTFSIDT